MTLVKNRTNNRQHEHIRPFWRFCGEHAILLYFACGDAALPSHMLPAVGTLRVMLKSSPVTACSRAGVLLIVALNDFSFTPSAFGIHTAAIIGLIGLWLGLQVTGHPLLNQLSLGARDMPFAIPKPLSFRCAEALRQKG